MQKVRCRQPNVPTSKREPRIATGRGRLASAGRRTAGRPALLVWGLVLAALAPANLGCQTLETTKTVVASTPANLAKTIAPSNHRNWKPHMAVLPRAEFQGDQLKVYNIRNFKYMTEDEYIIDDYDETFDLGRLQSVDFILVPFKHAPSLAHTMLSFGFDDGRRLAVSVEVRLEEGETYSPLKGAMRQHELMYVVGDERDLIKLRTQHRKSDVYIYRGRAAPQQARELLVDIMQRVNQLNEKPEFYDTFTNNCTTNIVRHINNLRPGRIPYDLRILLPGQSDRLAYDLGLLDTDVSFEETKRAARVNDLADVYRDSPDFSTLIRR